MAKRLIVGMRATKMDTPRTWDLITKASLYACPALSVAVQGAAFIPALPSQVLIFFLNIWMILTQVISYFTGWEQLPDNEQQPNQNKE